MINGHKQVYQQACILLVVLVNPIHTANPPPPPPPPPPHRHHQYQSAYLGMLGSSGAANPGDDQSPDAEGADLASAGSMPLLLFGWLMMAVH